MRLGFTATREIPEGGQLRILRRLLRIFEGTINVTEVTTGGAVGGDTIIALAALSFWPEAFHRLVLPVGDPACPPLVKVFEFGLAENWFEGEILWTGLPPLERNHTILDHSDCLEAFPKTPVEQRRSGTWATIRYAKSRDIQRVLTPLSD